MRNFGPFLYNLRTSAGLSLDELAKLVDSSRSSISRLENNGVPQPFKGTTRKTVIKLAEILCTSKHEIKRYLEFAEIDPSLLTEAEQIQVGFAPAIPRAGDTPDNIAALQHFENIYRQLLSQLETKKREVGENSIPLNINLKIQEYTRVLNTIQKKLHSTNKQSTTEDVQVTDAAIISEQVTCNATRETNQIATPSPSHHETQLSATNTASQPTRQDSLLVLLTDEEKKLLTSLLALDGDLLTGTIEGSSIERSRRAFLRQLLTLLGASFALPIDQLRPAEPDTSIISDDLISFFENTMTAHWELYHTGGAIRVVQGLDSWVKEIARLSRLAQGTSWQPRILRLLTMSYQLQSCVLRDIMDYQQAHAAYQRAFHVAQELDDAELMAAALAREGVTFIQQDKPKQAVIYLDGALTTIEGYTFPKLRGHILQALSEANAKAHQEQECWHHIGQAETIQEQQVQEYSLLRFNKASLAAQKGVNAVLLEDYQQAIKLLDASLVIYDPALIRGRARQLAQKAEAYYGLGAIEACTASANEALTLGRSAGSSKTIARVRTLYDHLLQSSWRKESSVTQLGETLAHA